MVQPESVRNHFLVSLLKKQRQYGETFWSLPMKFERSEPRLL